LPSKFCDPVKVAPMPGAMPAIPWSCLPYPRYVTVHFNHTTWISRPPERIRHRPAKNHQTIV